MLRLFSQWVFPILFLGSSLFGQTVADGGRPSLPGSGAASPSSAALFSGSPPPVSPAYTSGHQALCDALGHYARGEFDAARESYNVVLQKNPRSPDAYAGLTRVYLKQRKVEQAREIATKGVKLTDAPVVHVALGEVYFREGHIPEAEREWANVINSGYPSARAYWGLSRVRTALSLYQQAKKLLDKAHELDPDDPDIQKYWISSLSRAEQIRFWQRYLASPTHDDAETRVTKQHLLNYLQAMQNQPRHTCRMVSKIPSTEAKLLKVYTEARHVRGYAVAVSLNGTKGNLLLDTGGSGIVIDRRWARKAGITQVSEMPLGGIGDQGDAGGYFGFASSIKVGDLEFQDCAVSVVDKRSVLGEDGAIGTDQFGAFLIDIDFPNEKLKLQPLPKRPDESSTEMTLETGEEDFVPSEEESPGTAGQAEGAMSSLPARRGPRDRYVAPEMQSYTPAYRFGHHLLIPTSIGDPTPRLFLIDTGSSRNFMSLEAAQAITKVRDQPKLQVRGLSGAVENVYSADEAVLQFSRLRQENQNITAFDLSHLSEHVGTEISGLLGFSTLQMLEVRIDYRDGLVHFAYKPSPAPRGH